MELRSINGFDNYLISAFGDIFKIKNGKHIPLKLSNHNRGYLLVNLRLSKNVQCQKLVHRLVAECFLENPDSLPEVNHKDSDKKNNFKDNLEWCTRLENVKHSVNSGTFKINKKKSLALAKGL